MRKRLRRFLIPFLRGVIAVLALLGYLAASIGFPAPTNSASANAEKKPAAPVRACGCCTDSCAEQCCCCGPKSAAAEAAPEEPPAEAGIVWLSGEQVRKCRGLETL